MKKMISRAVLLLLAVLAVPLALLVTTFAIPAQFTKTYYGEFPAMFDRLKGATGRKIVLVGCSGLAFGLDHDLLAEQFPDYTVCPFGLYGTIGTKSMMDFSKVNISEGDIVILAPEQGPQTYSMYFNGEEIWLSTDSRPDILTFLPADEYANMAESLPGFLSRKYHCFTVEGAPDPAGIYSKSSFNENCTLVYDRPNNLMNGGYNPDDLASYDTEMPERAFLDYVNKYNAWITKKGAVLLFAFPPTNREGIEGGYNEETIRAFYDYLDEYLDCPLLGDPLDSVMDKEWFYDSNVHLNTPGSVVFTKTLAEALKAWLGDPSPVNIEIPEKPPLPGYEPSEGTGESEDADCFTYEETEDGLMITGLTMEGSTRHSLTIPMEADGKPVTGFLPETFQDDRFIEEIYLQSNIRSLPNGAFKGCASLTAVYLAPGEDPSHCQVPPGGGLIEDAESVYFYVERSRLADYIYNYFWSAYGSRIRGYDPQKDDTPEPTTAPSEEPPTDPAAPSSETPEDPTAPSEEDPTAPSEEDPTAPSEEDPTVPSETEHPDDPPVVPANEAAVRYYKNGGMLSEEALAEYASDTQVPAYRDEDHPYISCSYQTVLYPRINTYVPSGALIRPGYTLTGWNTAPDGTGTHIGIGSRFTVTPGTVTSLYAEWAPWSPEEDFSYVLIDPSDLPLLFVSAPKRAALETLVKDPQTPGLGAVITGYTGNDLLVSVPGSLGGCPVIGIEAEAFVDAPMETLILPDTLQWAANSFCKDCEGLQALYLYDNLLRIEQDPLGKHVTPATVHLNAYLPPVYTTTDHGQFANKMEMLINSDPDKPKMVFFGGCSVWYGVDASFVADNFRKYQVLNMGVIGGLSGRFQLDLIEPYLTEGDMLVHIPELTEYQLLCTTQIDARFFEMTEGNYDLIAELDLTDYIYFFQAFRDFLGAKHTLLDNNIAESTEYCIRADFMDERGSMMTERGQEYEAGSEPFPLIDADAFKADGMIRYYTRIAGKGVRICWAGSPLEEESVNSVTGAGVQDMVNAAIRDNKLPVTVILEFRDALFPARYFYDTAYHLNTEGASYYTSELIGRIPVK